MLFSNEYLNIIASTAIVYAALVLGLRLFGKKELSQLSVVDLIFILLISNAVQNAMTGPNVTLWGGLIAAGVLFAMNFLLKLIMYYFPGFGKLVQGEPVLLVYKGRMNQNNMRKAKISKSEIEEAVREHGVPSIDHVDLAMLEVDGNISVLSDDFKKRTMRKRKGRKGITEQL